MQNGFKFHGEHKHEVAIFGQILPATSQAEIYAWYIHTSRSNCLG